MHDDYINEDLVIENEDYFLNLDKNTTDEIFIYKLIFLTKYIKEDFWPFKKSRKDYISSFLKRNFKNKYVGDFFLITTIEPTLRLLFETDSKTAQLAYKRIMSIDIKKVVQNIPGKPSGVYYFFELMMIGFQLKASLAMSDIQTANKLVINNVHKLDGLFGKKFNALSKQRQTIKEDQFNDIVYPFFKYYAFIKDKHNAKILINLIEKNSQFNVTKIDDANYIKEIEGEYKNKLNTYLLMQEEYSDLIDDRDSKIKLNSYKLKPAPINDIYIILERLMSGLAIYDIDSAIFYLKYYKENLRYYSQSKSYFLLVEFYEILANSITDFPGENSSEFEKKYWSDNFFVNYLDIYSLVYFNEYKNSFYTNKLFDSYTLFKLNLENKRKEEAYYFSIEYLNNISNGLKNLKSDKDLSLKFKESISKELSSIIEFYINNNKSTDAINAISIFNIQKFYNTINRSDTSHKITYNNKNTLFSSKINNDLAAIELKNLHSKPTPATKIKDDLDLLKLKLKTDLVRFYKNQDDISLIASKITSSNVISQDKNSVYIDYFIFSEKLNIIISFNGQNKIYTSSIPIDFSSSIVKLISLKNDPNSSISEINSLNKTIYSVVIKPYEDILLFEQINNIYIRRNSVLSLISFKDLILTNNSLKKDMNIAFEGINKSNKNIDVNLLKSSLFATDLKFNNYPALKSARLEVELVKKSLSKKFNSSNHNIFMNSEFSISNLSKQFISNSNLIHIASHYSTKNNGSLLFGNGEVLSTRDLWKKIPTSINPKIVTISACESGLTTNESSDLDSLPNVFIDKGATLVLASTWKISDEATTFFMNVFYIILNITNDPISALNLTQLSFNDGNFDYFENKFNVKLTHDIKSSMNKYLHPFFWSGFQAITPK
jgi:CHAT domain-containing protein